MSARSGCAEADARYTAIVLDADVVAVVLDRGLDRWLHSNFSAMLVGFCRLYVNPCCGCISYLMFGQVFARSDLLVLRIDGLQIQLTDGFNFQDTIPRHLMTFGDIQT